MNDRTFFRIVIALLIVGTISTSALVLRIFQLQKESSLTAFIANECERQK